MLTGRKKTNVKNSSRLPYCVIITFCLLFSVFCSLPVAAKPEKSIARVWSEQLLWGIRLDSARPTVHARNLFHFSVAMWDAWAAFDADAKAVIHHEKVDYGTDVIANRKMAMSYAAYRLIMWRFRDSPNHIQTESSARRKMRPKPIRKYSNE